jgi:hypothetical protein
MRNLGNKKPDKLLLLVLGSLVFVAFVAAAAFLLLSSSVSNLLASPVKPPAGTIVWGSTASNGLNTWLHDFYDSEEYKLSGKIELSRWQSCFTNNYLKAYDKNGDMTKGLQKRDCLLNFGVRVNVLDEQIRLTQYNLDTIDALLRMVGDSAAKSKSVKNVDSLYGIYVALPKGKFITQPIEGASLSSQCVNYTDERGNPGKLCAPVGQLQPKFSTGQEYILCDGGAKKYMDNLENLVDNFFTGKLKLAQIILLFLREKTGIGGSPLSDVLVVPAESFLKEKQLPIIDGCLKTISFSEAPSGVTCENKDEEPISVYYDTTSKIVCVNPQGANGYVAPVINKRVGELEKIKGNLEKLLTNLQKVRDNIVKAINAINSGDTKSCSTVSNPPGR